jgi:hypothetical protein
MPSAQAPQQFEEAVARVLRAVRSFNVDQADVDTDIQKLHAELCTEREGDFLRSKPHLQAISLIFDQEDSKGGKLSTHVESMGETIRRHKDGLVMTLFNEKSSDPVAGKKWMRKVVWVAGGARAVRRQSVRCAPTPSLRVEATPPPRLHRSPNQISRFALNESDAEAQGRTASRPNLSKMSVPPLMRIDASPMVYIRPAIRPWDAVATSRPNTGNAGSKE